MYGTACLEARNEPRSATPITVSQKNDVSMSWIFGQRGLSFQLKCGTIAASLMSTSMPPKFSFTCAMSDRTASSLVTSVGTAIASAPSSPSSPSVCCRRVSSMSAIATFAPFPGEPVGDVASYPLRRTRDDHGLVLQHRAPPLCSPPLTPQPMGYGAEGQDGVPARPLARRSCGGRNLAAPCLIVPAEGWRACVVRGVRFPRAALTGLDRRGRQDTVRSLP